MFVFFAPNQQLNAEYVYGLTAKMREHNALRAIIIVPHSVGQSARDAIREAEWKHDLHLELIPEAELVGNATDAEAAEGGVGGEKAELMTR